MKKAGWILVSIAFGLDAVGDIVRHGDVVWGSFGLAVAALMLGVGLIPVRREPAGT